MFFWPHSPDVSQIFLQAKRMIVIVFPIVSFPKLSSMADNEEIYLQNSYYFHPTKITTIEVYKSKTKKNGLGLFHSNPKGFSNILATSQVGIVSWGASRNQQIQEKWTWTLKMLVANRNLLFQGGIFGHQQSLPNQNLWEMAAWPPVLSPPKKSWSFSPFEGFHARFAYESKRLCFDSGGVKPEVKTEAVTVEALMAIFFLLGWKWLFEDDLFFMRVVKDR